MLTAVIDSTMSNSSRGLNRKLDLISLQLFAAVCQHGSIGKTAKSEFIAASALSKRLSDLEAAVGAPLLYREAKGVRLTPAGEVLRKHAQTVLQDMDTMQAVLQEYTSGAKGQVRLNSSVAATFQFLPEDLALFAVAHKDIRISLQECLNTEVVRGVQDGLADVGICQGPLVNDGVQSRVYKRDRLVLALPANHPLAGRDPISFVESLDYDHIGLQDESAIMFTMRRAAFAAGKQLQTRLNVASLEAMCRMVSAGLGIGLIPDRAFALLRGVGELSTVALTDPWAEREVLVVARDFATLPITARLLVEHFCSSQNVK